MTGLAMGIEDADDQLPDVIAVNRRRMTLWFSASCPARVLPPRRPHIQRPADEEGSECEGGEQ